MDDWRCVRRVEHSRGRTLLAVASVLALWSGSAACTTVVEQRRDMAEPLRSIEELRSLPAVLLPATLGEVLRENAMFERVPYGALGELGAVELLVSAENPAGSEPAPLDTPVGWLGATWSLSDEASAELKWHRLLATLGASLQTTPVCGRTSREPGTGIRHARMPWRAGGVDLWLVHPRTIPGREAPRGVEPASVRVFVFLDDGQPPALAGSTPDTCD